MFCFVLGKFSDRFPIDFRPISGRREGVSLGGLSGRSLGNLWEVSTIIEKLSNVLGRLQKVPGNIDFTTFCLKVGVNN